MDSLPDISSKRKYLTVITFEIYSLVCFITRERLKVISLQFPTIISPQNLLVSQQCALVLKRTEIFEIFRTYEVESFIREDINQKYNEEFAHQNGINTLTHKFFFPVNVYTRKG